jgi:hypothetical protein
MVARAGTGSTTLAIRTSYAAVALAAVGLGGTTCARSGATASPEPVASNGRTDADQVSVPRRSNPDGGKTELAREALPVEEVGDCPAICSKLLRCRQGPFDTLSDCFDACEGSIDDRESAKTYRCVAKAKDCGHVKACGR